MRTVAACIYCKTPSAGQSKTRLSPPLGPDECAALSACFIRDLAATLGEVAQDGAITPYAVYTPLGSEPALRALLPPGFRLLPQCDGDLTTRLSHTVTDLLAKCHAGVILINADSPTLPAFILRAAAAAVRGQDAVVLSPALDGGYTLVGLSQPHTRVFDGIPWSTPEVFRLTVARAREIGVAVVEVAGWYDIDDVQSLRLLLAELAGEPLPFAQPGLAGAPALATRQFFAARPGLAAA